MTQDNPSLAANPDLDSWIAIRADGTVLLRRGKVDIGQKISSALVLLAAEELHLDPSRLVLAAVDTRSAPDEGVTSGSNSMEESGNAVRLAAATARERLLAQAAAVLGVAPDMLVLENGTITARTTNQATSYWELQGGKPFGVPVDLAARIHTAAESTLIGRSRVPLDMEEIVTGRQRFVQDLVLPDMLHARVVRPPHRHARLSTLAPACLRDLAARGVQVVRDGSFLAVAAEEEFVAIEAVRQLDAAVTWISDRDLGSDDVVSLLTTNDRESLPVIDGVPVDGPAAQPADPPVDARAVLSARYVRPYVMHASIGPSAALACLADGRLDVWTHSQGIFPLRQTIAEALSMPIDAVQLSHCPGAGSYGHNGADDAAFEAVLVARALAGRPVLLKWSRDDEHAWEPYSSAMVMDLSGAIASDGSVAAWQHQTYSDTHIARPRPAPGGLGPARLLAAHYLEVPVPEIPPQPNRAHHGGIHRNMEPLYRFSETHLIKHLVRDLPHRCSTMRTLGGFANVFALESFLDELAIAAGIDPVALRLRSLADPRARACIEAVSAELGSLDGTPEGTGRGLAFARYKNTKAYAAVGVELTVDASARISLVRAVIAGDVGQIIDPVGTRAQFEGGFIQAASWTLLEEVTWGPDGITSRDWESYPILGFDAVPEIKTVLLDQPDHAFLGAGEAVCGPTAGAIANALFRATGVRARRLPFTPDNLRAAALA